MPEIFDFTWNFWRGWIWPTATAFSTIEPVVTSTSFVPSVFLLLRESAYTAALAPARMTRTNSVFHSFRMGILSCRRLYDELDVWVAAALAGGAINCRRVQVRSKHPEPAHDYC